MATGKYTTNGSLVFDLGTIVGTTADTNSGSKSAGTLRVVLATDQPSLTNSLPVTLTSTTITGTVAVTQSGTWNITNAGTFAVQASLAAETTKVIGVVRNADGSGNLLTSTGSALDVNLKTSSITLPVSLSSTTVTGTVAVTQSTSPWVVSNGGTFAVQATIASGATAIAKAEDAASADADVGVPAMAVRKAAPGNTSGTDGDYEMLQMSAGRLWTSSTIDAAIPAGSNVIGHVILDTTSTTAVTQATGTNLHMVVDSGTITTVSTLSTITNVVHVDDNASSISVDWNGTQPVTGSGNATGALRVELANNGTGLLATVSTVTNVTTLGTITNVVHVDDNSGSLTVDNNGTFAVQATLTAETTKVIGVVRNADGSGNLLTSTTNALDVNLKTSSITLPVSLTSTTITGTVAVTKSGTWDITNAGTFAVQESGTQVQVDDAVFTPETSKVVMMGATADDIATDSVNEGDGGAVRMSLNRNLYVNIRDGQNKSEAGLTIESFRGVNASHVRDLDATNLLEDIATGLRDYYNYLYTQAPVSPAAAITFLANGLTNTAVYVVNTGAKLKGWYLYNPNTVVSYVQIFDLYAGLVTLGTTKPRLALAIPPGGAATEDNGLDGIGFFGGIAVAATTTATGSAAPTTALDCNFWYKTNGNG